jgi:hypothetical protein
MAKAKITVQAPADRPDVLDIRDAMQQVLDFFDLLTADEDKDNLLWNLTLATTNSPFHAEAEAVSATPGVDVRAVATTRINEASEFMAALGRGENPLRQIGQRRRSAAKRVWRRNTAGIGKTVVTFDIPKVAAVVVTPTIAAVALEASAREERVEFDYLPAARERTEHGSVEGILVDVGTDYNQPAIRIIERKSGKEIACRVDQSVIDEIARAASFRDVWERRRVRVRGKIAFDQQGKIIRVYARSITPIMPRTMTLRDIEDKGFTGDITIIDYIEKLREGVLGG